MQGQHPTDPARGMVGGRDLPVAIGVGVGLAVVFLGSLFWTPLAFTLVVAALTTVAYIEAAGVLRTVGRQLLTVVLVVGTLAMLAATSIAGAAGQVLGVLLLFALAVLWTLVDPGRDRVVATLGHTAAFGLWIGFLASYAVRLVSLPDGEIAVLAVIGAAAVTDIGGYAFGVAFGRHKVAPAISPNKSWEGLVGGVVAATVLGVLVLPRLGDTFTVAGAAVLVAVCGLASFAGDLTESMVKRDLGVKDLGGVLPGHGGVLDRVDGILFALPVGFHVVELLG